MKLGVNIGLMNPSLFVEAAVAAEAAGFESVWLPDHLILTPDVEGDADHGGRARLDTPMLDCVACLSYIAAKTSQIKLGTSVYLLALRHPLVAARAFAAIDVLSGGRTILGVGAGWLTGEWRALSIDPRDRGRRLDEAIELTRRLWQDPIIQHDGPLFPLRDVMFEPKPAQQRIPIHVGGESARALERAAKLGDGWLGMFHTPSTAADRVEAVTVLRRQKGRATDPFEVSVMGTIASHDDLRRWNETGVDRLIVAPWKGTKDVLDGIRVFGDRYLS